jgi:hypothetical protein
MSAPAPAVQVHSVESNWFRRSDKSIGTAEVQPPASTWASPADEGFRAAQAVFSPATGETGPAGLPSRKPQANLIPGSIGWPVGQQAGQQAGRAEDGRQAAGARRRSPEDARSRLAEFQRGANKGRSDAPWDFGAEK